MKENKFLLVSVKSKTPESRNQGQVFVVSKEDISSFIKKTLDEDTILLIDSVESFCSDPLSLDELS